MLSCKTEPKETHSKNSEAPQEVSRSERCVVWEAAPGVTFTVGPSKSAI